MSMGNDRHWNADEDSKLMNQYKPYFDKLDDSKWERLSYKERHEVLQKIEEYEAKSTHRPVANFQTKDGMPMASRGYYTCSNNTITQNYQYTMANSSQPALKNLLHEGRHAYQWDCVNNPQNHPEVSHKQIAEWKKNFDNYISAKNAEDKMQYFMQPVEQDARNYADARVEEYSKLTSKDNFKIENKQVNGTSQTQGTGVNSRSNGGTVMDRWEDKSPEEKARIQQRQKEIADKWAKQQSQKKNSNSASEAESRGERIRERGKGQEGNTNSSSRSSSNGMRSSNGHGKSHGEGQGR